MYSLGLFGVPESCSHSLKQASMYILYMYMYMLYIELHSPYCMIMSANYCVLISPDNDDFTVMDNSATFGSGAIDGSTACINIDIIDDSNFEGDHVFQVQIRDITPSIASGTGSLASVMIQDNNGNLCC